MNTLSYLTLDSKEVSNSARLAALAATGLVPDTVGVQGPACGVLQREAAALAGGAPCVAWGTSDTFDETVSLELSGGYGNANFFLFGTTFSRIAGQPQPLNYAGAANVSDGWISPLDENSGVGLNGAGIGTPGPYPLSGSLWADGFVSLAIQANGTQNTPQTAAAVTSRVQGTQSNDPTAIFGDSWLQASLLWASATTATLRIDGIIRSQPSGATVITVPTSFGPLAVPTGTFWIGLRTAGNTITAELWTSNPNANGTPLYTVSYVLSTAAELAAFTAAGRQGYRLSGTSNQPRPPAIAATEFVTAPTCVQTCNLYPSPFLYPSPNVFPAVCGTPSSILSTTPWTDSSRPESAEFCGFYIDDIAGLDGDTTRDVTQKPGGLGGASLGTLIQQGREVKVHGWLIARNCRGLEYGKEWLIDQLAASCHPCGDSVMRLRTAVPSPDDGTNDTQGLYYLYDVGLTDGPVVTPVAEDDCTVAEVTFTITTGNGYKYQYPTALVPATTFVSVGGSFTQQVPIPAGLGTNGAIITIKAGSSDLLGVFPAAAQATYPADNLWPSDCLYPNDGGLPVTLPITTCPSGFSIPLIPAGGTLVIDSARHRITYTDATGNTQDGTFLLAQDTARAIDWLEADACNPGGGDSILIGAASYGPDATVQIDIQHRER